MAPSQGNFHDQDNCGHPGSFQAEQLTDSNLTIISSSSKEIFQSLAFEEVICVTECMYGAQPSSTPIKQVFGKPLHASPFSHPHAKCPLDQHPLPIALRHTLQLILLLDRIGVTASLRRINELLSQALSHRLDIAESGFARTDC